MQFSTNDYHIYFYHHTHLLRVHLQEMRFENNHLRNGQFVYFTFLIILADDFEIKLINVDLDEN